MLLLKICCRRSQPVLSIPPTYRGTSLTRNRTTLRPYRRPMPRVLGGFESLNLRPAHSTDSVRVQVPAPQSACNLFKCTCRDLFSRCVHRNEPATFHGGAGHFCGRVRKFATGRGLLHFSSPQRAPCRRASLPVEGRTARAAMKSVTQSQRLPCALLFLINDRSNRALVLWCFGAFWCIFSAILEI